MIQAMHKQSLNNCYKHYKESGGTLDKKQYKEICYMFNKLLIEDIVDKGNTYTLPYRLGEICVYKNKMQYQKLKLDYKVWKETGIVAYHLNEHSDGWYSMLEWRKKGCVLKNRNKFEFKLTRDNSRRISKIMQTEGGHQIYKIGKGLKYAGL
jgi:hypothetical protein